MQKYYLINDIPYAVNNNTYSRQINYNKKMYLGNNLLLLPPFFIIEY